MNKPTLIRAVSGETLSQLCESIQNNINDGGFSWDGRWNKFGMTYQAVLVKKPAFRPNRPGPR